MSEASGDTGNSKAILKNSLIAGVIFLLLLPIIGLVSIFQPDDNAVKSESEYNAEETQIYIKTKPIVDKFYEQVREKLKEEERKLIASNTTSEEEVKEDGSTETEVVCNITVTTEFNYVNIGCVLAYLVCVEDDMDSFDVDETAIIQFLNEICTISIENTENNAYTIRNQYISEEEIAKKYFPDDESKSSYFLAECAALNDFFEVSETEISITHASDLNLPEGQVNEVPLYLQYGSPWSSVPYGYTGTIASSGCCPTCIAMVLSYIKKEPIYPDTVVAYIGNRHYTAGVGTAWTVFDDIAEHWSVTVSNIGMNSIELLDALNKGNLVMASMGPGTFTKGGHFIVLTGVKDGGITVNDPNDNAIKNHKEKTFELSLIVREAKNFWVFEVK